MLIMAKLAFFWLGTISIYIYIYIQIHKQFRSPAPLQEPSPMSMFCCCPWSIVPAAQT